MARFSSLLLDSVKSTRLCTALRVEQASGAHHECVAVEDWRRMHDSVGGAGVQVAVFDPYAGGPFDAAPCTSLHARFPLVVLLPYTGLLWHRAADVLELAALGIREMMCQEDNDGPLAFRQALTRIISDASAGRIVAELEEVLTPDLSRLFRRLLSATDDAIRPDALARGEFCHAKTLRDRLRFAGLPPTNKLIVWARLFRAACLMEDRGRTVASVALALGFSSTSAFQKQSCRYLGVGPREVAERGGLAFTAGEFLACWRAHSWVLPGERGTVAGFTESVIGSAAEAPSEGSVASLRMSPPASGRTGNFRDAGNRETTSLSAAPPRPRDRLRV